MAVEGEDDGIKKEALVAMLVDDIDIRVVREDGGDEIAFVEVVGGGEESLYGKAPAKG